MEASALKPCTYGGSDLRPCPKPMFIVNPPEGTSTAPVVEVIVESVTPEKYEFVGVTEALVVGTVGIVGYIQACQAEFTGSAKVCDTQQYLESSDLPVVAGPAWIVPTSDRLMLQTYGYVIDGPSGVNMINARNCSGNSEYAAESAASMVLANNKLTNLTTLGYVMCDETKAVVCCDLR
jgi:hypothetical protein